ncbi:2,3-bisphosphoglycerate-independent phosphoglycerate mutase [Pseudoalteromonas sp. J010]|uniref:2,3-bisphosphoglycerate-independent phosphoglycerate mutase n=1 Tax=Pseudoalteromonas sp. J010 TaxID=998465 RepID=UPI000F649BCE|nr:2,3-bisphosphoglycerate-independent phosphoglycerate mutase [Pseudoalteromonas sp. J010]RRS07736.1 2,3-bisphosphoglycerate-independent phosphoglycerate mutase [Pseudoalteromonas sp. J010]
MTAKKKPLVLMILDGWGYREESESNAILAANTPVLDELWRSAPHTLISGSGLLSPGGVHSHEDHIVAAIKLAAERGATVYLHAFLDGRDTPPRSAQASIEKIEALMQSLNCGRLASIVGRYYAMDRDNRWDRVELAYNLMVSGEAEFTYQNGVEALQAAYARDENDEFVKASIIAAEGESAATINDGDTVIFMNFRADRARQMTRAFVDADFNGFEKHKAPNLSAFVMMTEYAADIKAPIAFAPEALVNVLGEWLAKHNKTQLRISETEKYAHVTFFFSGGREDLFEGEKRELIPSPQVATYDLQPEMNSEMLTDKLVAAIHSGEFDVIICNYPNGDMVGHSGVFEAAVKACEAVDKCIGRVVAALKESGGEALITADHGNAEQMLNPKTGQAHTAHTSEPVPFIYVGRDAEPQAGKALSDVAPTMLHLLGMEQPSEMTGTPIMRLK